MILRVLHQTPLQQHTFDSPNNGVAAKPTPGCDSLAATATSTLSLCHDILGSGGGQSTPSISNHGLRACNLQLGHPAIAIS